jgi:hypothetical protein
MIAAHLLGTNDINGMHNPRSGQGGGEKTSTNSIFRRGCGNLMLKLSKIVEGNSHGTKARVEIGPKCQFFESFWANPQRSGANLAQLAGLELWQ